MPSTHADLADLQADDQPAPAAEATEAVRADHHTLDKLTSAATVRMVYGEPVMQGDTIVIPAAEVLTAVGFGRGADAGPSHGSGGGGWTVARPVAVIVIANGAVRVQPIFDMNKLLLTVVPFLGVMATLLLRRRRPNRHSD